MVDSLVHAFANEERALVVAPAGHGKTELIARALTASHGRQLVLTHTHAGVRALGARIKRMGITGDRYALDTISGFALRYVTAYPKLSELVLTAVSEIDWPLVYKAASKLFKADALQAVLRHTYAGVMVDEYQDCSDGQHALITGVAEILPCRVVGDPLQGIFDFSSDRLPDWETEVVPFFRNIGKLPTAWRWKGKNEPLAEWLSYLREQLEAGQSVDLVHSAVDWRRIDRQAQWESCMERRLDDSVVAILRQPEMCYQFASGLKGVFTCMEEVECRDLLKYAEKLDSSSGSKRAAVVIDFASRCMTKVGTLLKSMRGRLLEEKAPTNAQQEKFPAIASCVEAVKSSASFAPVLDLMEALADLPEGVIYRRELWHEMERSVTYFASKSSGTLRDAAWHVRDRARRAGRRVAKRTVARTYLVKGLEFEHSIILDSDPLDAKNFYVAATRGVQTLTIFSKDPVWPRSP